MCVALPGKVLEVQKDVAVVDFNGNHVNAVCGLLPVAEGDYVLVHAGCILQKLNHQEAMDMLELFGELEEFN